MVAAVPEELFRATVVGVKVKGGVVLATDKRLSYGSLVLSKSARKIFVLNDRTAIAFAGLYGDAGGLIRFLEAELRFYQLTSGVTPTVKTVAKRLSTIMYSYKWFPFIVETLVGGIEPDGSPKLYVLDPLGSIIEEDYAAVGTGAAIAFGLLERDYSETLTVEEAEKLAIASMRAAIGRDVGSGDGIDVATITGSGVRQKSIVLRLVEG
ncbi:MAG: archaeal proteasome endopeptidase complex subunit beta [Acidilobaceae archaeon]